MRFSLWSALFFVTLSLWADDTQPLKSGAPDGVGPLSLASLNNTVVGAASTAGGARPDIFVVGRGKTAAVFLFKWVRDTPEGVPVFAAPVLVKSPGIEGTVFQSPDKSIHGLWLDGNTIIHSVFDSVALSFKEVERITVDSLPNSPRNIAARVNADGSVDVVLEVSAPTDPEKYPGREDNTSSLDWRPYDAAGISTIPFRYRYLFGAHFPALLKGPATEVRQITPGTREGLFGLMHMSFVQFGADRSGIISGSRMGNLLYFPFAQPPKLETGKKLLVADPSGNAMRHPSVSAGVCTYTGANGTTDLLSGGEGAVYYYKLSGRFTPAGAPIYEKPVAALQENADLYTGTLPAPAVADWDGDGVPDILVGNSEGFVLFFKNIGTLADPRFLPGERVQAGGRDIHFQAGYSGSVQGTPEARWGYLSATPFDWNEDSLLDLILSDITGNYFICVNRGTKTEPKLDLPHPIYCDGIDLHGMWRCRAAVARLGDRIGMVIVDGDDNFHLYWKIDAHNVEDGGKLKMEDGSFIFGSYDPAGGTGRLKLDFYDGNKDGIMDLVIGTGRRASIPNRNVGFPMPALGMRTLGTPLFMRNTGSNEQPTFAMPIPFLHTTLGIIQPGGSHESGAVLTDLGGDGPNLLAGNEFGRLFLYRGANIKYVAP